MKCVSHELEHTEFRFTWKKNGITDVCSTVDCCPLLTICPRCCLRHAPYADINCLKMVLSLELLKTAPLCSDWTTVVLWGNSKSAAVWRCHWYLWILIRLFWLNHSCVLRQFLLTFLNVFPTISSGWLVDRPTQLICISDIYSTDKFKRHSRAIC